jgi:putative membrane-bound dehydrogenase-like protein
MKTRRLFAMSGLAAFLIVSPLVRGEDPKLPDTERSSTHALSPEAAAAGFDAPSGFRVDVFAAEPEVRNPVAMAWDARGRLWVAENYTYSDSTQTFDLGLRDRVLIFEDVDGDGRHDRRKVFTDDVQRLGGLATGRGGVWLICPPNLLFVPDRDGDDVPDAPAEVVLDGFRVAVENYHTFANGLKWGPDGWLYGRCGASSPGEVGPPGTPFERRIPLRGGLWRYHPQRKRFEVLAHGTTNPWGHDWDALGECFFINTVNGHLWHLIPGAHFARPHTIEPNPRAYAIIDQHADHYHWEHEKEMKYPYKPSGEDNRLGGGHAHSGLMIYLADQWPAEYRGKLFTLNYHGRRMNVERLERAGSGYVGRHEPDRFQAADPWFRGIDLSYGPDGSVYAIDWSDTGECHEHDGIHRNSGRIFRFSYGRPSRIAAVDVSALSAEKLVALHTHANEWYVRKAREVLADRAAAGEPLDGAKKLLRSLFESDRDPVRKVRALYSLYAIGGADPGWLRDLLRHEHEAVRVWSLRFLTDAMPLDTIDSRRGGEDVPPPDDLARRLGELARHDPSGLVRLALASTLQRLPVRQRVELARDLLSRPEDAGDHNIPSLIWTGLIPVAEADPSSLVTLASRSRQPEVSRWIARRLGEDIEARPAPIDALLDASVSAEGPVRAQVVLGLADALTGWRKARQPGAWKRLEPVLSSTGDTDLRERVRDLNVLFGDGRALEEVRRLSLDEAATIDVRKAALRSLIESRPPDLREICRRLLRVRFLNAVAVRGLSLFDDPAIGREIAAQYRSFHPSERPAAMDTLASRPSFARALLDAIAAGKIPRGDLSAFHARQIRSFGDRALSDRLEQVWGVLRESASDRRARIDALKGGLDPATLAGADLPRGRATFDRLCASCHTLHGQGGSVGPDLTGAGRDNLDYLLENLVDPSASVSADFRMVVVAMGDGRVLNGLVRARTDRTLTLQTQNEALVLDRDEIEDVKPSNLSLMPEGQLDPLSREEIRDLVGYLMHRTQVPLPGHESVAPKHPNVLAP